MTDPPSLSSVPPKELHRANQNFFSCIAGVQSPADLTTAQLIDAAKKAHVAFVCKISTMSTAEIDAAWPRISARTIRYPLHVNNCLLQLKKSVRGNYNVSVVCDKKTICRGWTSVVTWASEYADQYLAWLVRPMAKSPPIEAHQAHQPRSPGGSETGGSETGGSETGGSETGGEDGGEEDDQDGGGGENDERVMRWLGSRLKRKRNECNSLHRKLQRVARERDGAMQREQVLMQHGEEMLQREKGALRARDEAVKREKAALRARNEAVKRERAALRARDEAVKRERAAIRAREEMADLQQRALRTRDESVKREQAVIRARDKAADYELQAVRTRDEAVRTRDDAVRTRDEAVRTRDEAVKREGATNVVNEEQAKRLERLLLALEAAQDNLKATRAQLQATRVELSKYRGQVDEDAWALTDVTCNVCTLAWPTTGSKFATTCLDSECPSLSCERCIVTGMKNAIAQGGMYDSMLRCPLCNGDMDVREMYSRVSDGISESDRKLADIYTRLDEQHAMMPRTTNADADRRLRTKKASNSNVQIELNRGNWTYHCTPKKRALPYNERNVRKELNKGTKKN